MRAPARPRLPDGDCVFISGARIVARAIYGVDCRRLDGDEGGSIKVKTVARS